MTCVSGLKFPTVNNTAACYKLLPKASQNTAQHKSHIKQVFIDYIRSHKDYSCQQHVDEMKFIKLAVLKVVTGKNLVLPKSCRRPWSWGVSCRVHRIKLDFCSITRKILHY